MPDEIKTLRDAITAAGRSVTVAGLCGISSQSVNYWCKKGHMPATEYTGETDYSAVIVRLARARGHNITKAWLLNEFRPSRVTKHRKQKCNAQPTAGDQ